jgi:deazaflavin-dependent oxidoreductase (nitroreductase family)
VHRLLNLLSPIPFPAAFQRAFGRLNAAWLRATHGRGPLTSGALVLTTHGRRSGKERSTVLLHFDLDGRRYVVASFAGADQPPAWYLNLLADPQVAVEIRGVRTAVLARVLSADEAAAIWPRLDAAYPGFVRYRARTSRSIPVVELVRAEVAQRA